MFAKNTGNRRGSVKRAASLDRASGNNNKNQKTDFAIPTSNRFSALPIDSAKATAKKPRAPAPVTITDKTNPNDLLQSLKINYKLKISGIGVKIFTENVDDFALLCSKLSELNVEFFSHSPGEDKLFKLMLHGLPEFPTNEISEHLKSQNNVTVTKITMLKSEGSFKRYLVLFDPKENSKADIKNIKVILNHIIRWLPAKRINRGPTQCFNCGMYGHGISACFRKPKCILCGGDHISKECSFGESNDQRVFKCHNCRANNLQHNHKANDPQCPSRQKYMEIRASANNKKKSGQISTPQYVHSNNLFPPLPPPPLMRTFADAAKPQLQKQRTTNIRQAQSNAHENDLFTFAEISEIMLSCVNELAKCTSKIDQMRVVANMFSYAFK